MLLLQGQREAVDDGPQNLQQLRDAIVALRLVHEPVEHVVDGLPDERPGRGDECHVSSSVEEDLLSACSDADDRTPYICNLS